GGWVRVPRPVSAPGSMRPGATLSGIPTIDEPTPAVARTAPAEPAPVGPAAERRGITAEYGAAGRPRSTHDPIGSTIGDAIETASTTELAAVVDPDAELDEMTTVPAVRRTAGPRGSTTPTEQVPRVIDHAEARAPVEHDEQWQRLLDILEYRRLRGDALRGQPQPEAAIERRAELERSLQPRPPVEDERAALRRYHRFACSIPARLGPPLPGRSAPIPASVEIEDVSAGGARITIDQPSLAVGERVWLTIDLGAIERSRLPSTARQVVLDARVVW